MKKNFLYFLSLALNGALLYYIVTQKPKPSDSTQNSFTVEKLTREVYCEKFDQHNRLQADDLSNNIHSVQDYQDSSYDWDVCESKKKAIPKLVRKNNGSLDEPFYEPVQYCSFTPRIEQMYQLGFYGGSDIIRWPKFYHCAILPPPNYRWPNKHITYPVPAGETAIFWSNLGLKVYNEVLSFNPGYPKNYIHFDTPYYDIYHEATAVVGAKYIPFGKKIRSMLDIGSGAGSLGFALTKRYDVQVLNTVRPEFPYCEFITERGGLCMLLDSNRPMPFAKFTFDVIHHSWVYHGSSAADWRTILLEQNRLIRPGGYLWIRDGFSRAILQTIRYLLVGQLGYRILYQEEKPQILPAKVFFASTPFELEWSAILVKPNRIKGNEFFC